MTSMVTKAKQAKEKQQILKENCNSGIYHSSKPI
jgi:hypothetical protein